MSNETHIKKKKIQKNLNTAVQKKSIIVIRKKLFVFNKFYYKLCIFYVRHYFLFTCIYTSDIFVDNICLLFSSSVVSKMPVIF